MRRGYKERGVKISSHCGIRVSLASDSWQHDWFIWTPNCDIVSGLQWCFSKTNGQKLRKTRQFYSRYICKIPLYFPRTLHCSLPVDNSAIRVMLQRQARCTVPCAHLSRPRPAVRALYIETNIYNIITLVIGMLKAMNNNALSHSVCLSVNVSFSFLHTHF